jgi:hypothetical protein
MTRHLFRADQDLGQLRWGLVPPADRVLTTDRIATTVTRGAIRGQRVRMPHAPSRRGTRPGAQRCSARALGARPRFRPQKRRFAQTRIWVNSGGPGGPSPPPVGLLPTYGESLPSLPPSHLLEENRKSPLNGVHAKSTKSVQ